MKKDIHPDYHPVIFQDMTTGKQYITRSTAKSDMGRVIGRRGRVAKAIRIVAQAAADEEGLQAEVEFID